MKGRRGCMGFWMSGNKSLQKKKFVQKDIGGPGSDIPRLYVTLAS